MSEPLQIRAWAERILFGPSLADKLFGPAQLVDTAPGASVTAPAQPGRSAALRLGGDERVPLPSPGELDKPHMRGRMLHFFANHELLALELMALSLLRFPDAPAAYRRGVVHTMREEQEHLTGYLERMRACGVELGDQPVNDFFWRWLVDASDPMDFVVHMNLTFEQANLDYARYYAAAFAAAGDEATAALLRGIADDEVGHVRHGLKWFNRWRDGGPSEWEAYQAHLKRPLGPFRARGLGFNREARERVGFSPVTIDELAISPQSQGRPPTVWWFDPCAEEQIASAGAFTAPALLKELARDLESLLLFVAAADDVVWLRRRPTTPFLASLQRTGVDIPELVTDLETLAGRRLEGLAPWGWSPAAERDSRPLREQLRPGGEGALGWSERLAPLFAKTFGVTLLPELLVELADPERLAPGEALGRTCGTEAEVGEALANAWRQGFDTAVVKVPLAAAGRGHGLVTREEPEAGAAWVRRQLARHHVLVVEPWLDRVVDLSINATLGRDGTLRRHGLSRFITTGQGRYLGAVLGSRWKGLPTQVRRFVHGDGRHPDWLERSLEAVVERVAERLAAAGYWGPFGVDALVYRDLEGRLRLQPLIEVNPRLTMGRVASELEKRVRGGRLGLWLHLTTLRLERAGHATPSSFVAAAQARRPVVVSQAASPQLLSGWQPTTDPARTKRVLSVLLVAESWEDARAACREVGLETGVPIPSRPSH